MDRTPIIVVGTVLVALALFGLKLRSDRSGEPGDLWADGGGVAASGRGLDGLPGGADDVPGGGLGAAAGKAGERRYAALQGTQRGVGRDGLGRGGAKGAAGVVGGARSARSGLLTGSKGTGRLSGDGSSVSLAGAPDRQGQVQKRSRDIVEFLSEQPPTLPDYAADPGADPDNDVVLEVSTAEDSDKAIDLRNVEEARDGVGLELKEDSVLAFPNAGNAKGDAGSISFDLDPEWVGADQTDNSFVQIRTPHGWDNRMQLVKNGRYLRFILTDNTSREADISLPIDQWEPGKPHTVTATWGEGRTQLYVDGRRVGQNTYEGRFEIPPNTPMYVGSDLPGGSYAGASATIQNFKVYGRALAEDEVGLR